MPYRCTLHHTVGRYEQFFNDYHYMIAYNPKTKQAYVKKGIYKPEDNDNTGDGKYAPHCALANTGNIGVAICANLNYDFKTNTSPTYPITAQQIELAFYVLAELCVKYNINVNEVQTHYERDRKLKKPSGKVDIIFIPSYPKETANKEDVGNFIRNKVRWYIVNKVKNKNNLKYI